MDSSKTKHTAPGMHPAGLSLLPWSWAATTLTDWPKERHVTLAVFQYHMERHMVVTKLQQGQTSRTFWDSSCVLGAVLGAKKAAECCAVSFPYWNSFLKFRLIKTHLVFPNGCRKHRRPVTRAAASPTNLQYLWKKPGTTVLVMEHWR